jgi:hypothetical protein
MREHKVAAIITGAVLTCLGALGIRSRIQRRRDKATIKDAAKATS